MSAPETMPSPMPHPEGPELRMSRVNAPHLTALHCHLRTMDLTKLGNQPCSHSIVVGMSRHFSMSPTLPLEHLPLCIRSSLVSSQSRASRMTSPKWKVILSFPRWMREEKVPSQWSPLVGIGQRRTREWSWGTPSPVTRELRLSLCRRLSSSEGMKG